MEYIEKLKNVEKEAGIKLKETEKEFSASDFSESASVKYFSKDTQNRITGASIYLTIKKLSYTTGKISKTEKNKVEGKRSDLNINDEHLCHIIARRFAGEHKSENLFYGSRKLNNSMERIEAFIAEHLRKFTKDSIYYEVRLLYVGAERRVDSIEITFISSQNSNYPRKANIRNEL